MKVLILTIADKRHMTMISPYIDYLEENHIEYDIIRANRYEKQQEYLSVTEHRLGKIYVLDMLIDIRTPKWKKLIPFLKFKFAASRLIIKNQYDYIIVWNENSAAMFADILALKYKQRYCINIRDEFDFLGIKQLVDLAMKYCHFFTCNSPEDKLLTSEKGICLINHDTELTKCWKRHDGFRGKNQPIRITHLGFYSKTKKTADEMAEIFGNDTRFELYFYGNGFDDGYKKLIDSKGYKNIFVGGPFPYEDTAIYLQNTDIINSYYNRGTEHEYNMSFGIKHSYTPLLYIPGLTDENTSWSRLSKPYNLTFLVNEKNRKTLADDLYNWYRGLDYDTFCKNCDAFNEKYTFKSQRELANKLDGVLKTNA